MRGWQKCRGWKVRREDREETRGIPSSLFSCTMVNLEDADHELMDFEDELLPLAQNRAAGLSPPLTPAAAAAAKTRPPPPPPLPPGRRSAAAPQQQRGLSGGSGNCLQDDPV
ncbi:uncharacterized protein LOC135166583 [Diachasmimorpha longicaudata]|uniref:uncharacterized protein LOC135166583 n=1 Tax=Diachasmimorpha longicaudata TaxID=58733 RepID=UPI0030B889AC